jgi:enoyl-CoA hydratase/carnithine racemase
VLQRLLEIEAPLIAAVNGPATVHSEYVLLADITVASEDAVFADKPHLGFGIVPGDGIQVIYEELLGVNRARYFALTQQRLETGEAQALGFVNEVVPRTRCTSARSRSQNSSQRSHSYSCATRRWRSASACCGGSTKAPSSGWHSKD